MKVLIIDDDPASKRYTSMALEEAGIAHKTASCAADARAMLEGPEGESFDVLLLDVEQPRTKGWEFLSDLRAAGQQIPVVFVTVRESSKDRVRGLNLGADDYIVRPFEFSELVARLRAVLRRSGRNEVIRVGDLAIHPRVRRVERGHKPVELTPLEFDVLWLLVQAAGKPVSQEDLLAYLDAIDVAPETPAVEVHVNRLREKLEADGSPLIETVEGAGYRLRM